MRIISGGIVLLLLLTSCATAHYRAATADGSSGLYLTQATTDTKEVKIEKQVDLSGFSSIGLIFVGPEDLKSYFIRLFRGTNTVKQFYDSEGFADLLINQKSVRNGGISDSVGRYLLAKEIGPFLTMQVDCFSTGQITTLWLRVIDSTTGNTVLLIERACTDGTFEDFDSLLIYPVVNEYTKWFQKNVSKS